MDFLLLLKIITAVGCLTALYLFYQDTSRPSVLGVSISFGVIWIYYMSDPTDLEFIKEWGRPLVGLNFLVFVIDMLVRIYKGGKHGN